MNNEEKAFTIECAACKMKVSGYASTGKEARERVDLIGWAFTIGHGNYCGTCCGEMVAYINMKMKRNGN